MGRHLGVDLCQLFTPLLEVIKGNKLLCVAAVENIKHTANCQIALTTNRATVLNLPRLFEYRSQLCPAKMVDRSFDDEVTTFK